MFCLDQQSHRRWCYDTNQRCSISTMLQTTMMLWFWSTMSRTMMMFQYWSMMLQTMLMIGFHNLAKWMNTRFKNISPDQRNGAGINDVENGRKEWAIVKKRNELNFNYSELLQRFHRKHYSQTRVWIHVMPCCVKQSTQSMTETGIQCPLSRVTGPCLG